MTHCCALLPAAAGFSFAMKSVNASARGDASIPEREDVGVGEKLVAGRALRSDISRERRRILFDRIS
jgi:hypothetical protein